VSHSQNASVLDPLSFFFSNLVDSSFFILDFGEIGLELPNIFFPKDFNDILEITGLSLDEAEIPLLLIEGVRKSFLFFSFFSFLFFFLRRKLILLPYSTCFKGASPNLKELNISGSGNSDLPEFTPPLPTNLVHLRLEKLGLKKIPTSWQPLLSQLTSLSLASNSLNEVPEDLQKLRVLDLSKNKLTHLDCSRLPTHPALIDVSENLLSNFIGNCTSMYALFFLSSKGS